MFKNSKGKVFMGQYYQKFLTKNLSPLLDSSGINHLTKPFYSGRGQILVFHRVIPPSRRERIHNHLSLEISPALLEDIIGFFRRKNYDFIDLDMLPAWLEENFKTNRKFVIFTFDDGYKDNLEFAYPVFKKHKVPFTIYITSSFPDKRAIIWWYIIEDIILNNNHIQYKFPVGSINIKTNSSQMKERTFLRLRKLINCLHDKNLESELSGFFEKYGYSTVDNNGHMVLDWDEISALSRDPLVTIGAHTLNHFNLRNLTKEQSLHEILESKKLIESKTDREVLHFAYPFGEFGSREIESVKECNFLSATTTVNANVFHEHLLHQFSLPRLAVNALTSEVVLNLQVNGFYPAILNKFKRVVY
jgi:peptidoglycan/xylan/chitin deacetylase (PgdA/CDA1 family)